MSSTMSDVERAEMMLSLGMNEEGNALDATERQTLEEFVAANQPGSPVEVHSAASVEPSVGAIPTGGAPTDIQGMIQAEIAKALGGGAGQQQPVSLDQVLKSIDPRDSDAALALFEWLCDNGRLGIVGTLQGGGYLLHYSEPKGSSKAGYTPGGTKGGRMVDQAVQQARDSGAKPRQTGLCDKCWSAVEQHEDGSITTDDDTKSATCSSGGTHNFNA